MFVDNRDLTREERTEAASDFLTKGRDSDTIRAVMVLTNEISTLRGWLKELEGERDCAKCHVEDSEFCDEVNAAIADIRADAKRLKTELAAVLLKEGEAFRLGEKAILGLMEERDAIQGWLKVAEEANKNLLEEHQALVRNAAVERKEAREEIAALNGAKVDRKFVDVNGRASRCPFWQEYDAMVTCCNVDESVDKCGEVGNGGAPIDCPLRSRGILVTRSETKDR